MRKNLKKILVISPLILATTLLNCTAPADISSQSGGNPTDYKPERRQQSPNFDGNRFKNPIETETDPPIGDFFTGASRWLFGEEVRRPKNELPVVHLDRTSFEPDPVEGLRVTWMGHSSVLIEIDGRRILTDPVWNKRCSPISFIGPTRFHPTPIPLEELPTIDAVLISHDHFDHLEKDSVCLLAKTGVRFFVPLGAGAHLEEWGINLSQIVELDWWETSEMVSGGIRLIATPARHYSGRGPFSKNSTLWVTWTIVGPRHRVFFSGDTGLFPGFTEIGKKFGPFDVTLIKIGAYDRMWPDVHLDPEQAVDAHLALKGDLFLPIHWGTFNLAFHDWSEPADRLQKEGIDKSIRFAIPRPGQMVTLTDPPKVERWWEDQS